MGQITSVLLIIVCTDCTRTLLLLRVYESDNALNRYLHYISVYDEWKMQGTRSRISTLLLKVWLQVSGYIRAPVEGFASPSAEVARLALSVKPDLLCDWVLCSRRC